VTALSVSLGKNEIDFSRLVDESAVIFFNWEKGIAFWVLFRYNIVGFFFGFVKRNGNKQTSAGHQLQEDRHMWYPNLEKPNSIYGFFYGTSASFTKGAMRSEKQKISAFCGTIG
jgi:hypothetical protein